jgi:hypothetical protein
MGGEPCGAFNLDDEQKIIDAIPMEDPSPPKKNPMPALDKPNWQRFDELIRDVKLDG